MARENTVRQVIDTALLSIIGRVNKAVYSASQGRTVLYRFRGRPGVLLTITGPAAPASETAAMGYLPDGDDYIVLASETETSLPAALRTATSAAVERANQQIPVDITVLTGSAERTALLNRLLKHASIAARHEVTRLREVPIARLTPLCKPASDSSAAISGIWFS
jgi:hypothetical protein